MGGAKGKQTIFYLMEAHNTTQVLDMAEESPSSSGLLRLLNGPNAYI